MAGSLEVAETRATRDGAPDHFVIDPCHDGLARFAPGRDRGRPTDRAPAHPQPGGYAGRIDIPRTRAAPDSAILDLRGYAGSLQPGRAGLRVWADDVAAVLEHEQAPPADVSAGFAEKYDYESGFLGEKACALTAQAFAPAVGAKRNPSRIS